MQGMLHRTRRAVTGAVALTTCLFLDPAAVAAASWFRGYQAPGTNYGSVHSQPGGEALVWAQVPDIRTRPVLSRVDASGAIVWQTQMLDGVGFYAEGFRPFPSPAGGVLLAGTGYDLAGEGRMVFGQINETGTPAWMWLHHHNWPLADEFFAGSARWSEAGTVIVSGQIFAFFEPGMPLYPWLGELDPATGALLHSTVFPPGTGFSMPVDAADGDRLTRLSDPGAAHGSIHKGFPGATTAWHRTYELGTASGLRPMAWYRPGEHLLLGATDLSDGRWLLLIDPSTGDPIRSRLYEDTEPLNGGAVATPDGGLLLGGWRGVSGGPGAPYLLRLDPDLDPVWMRSYDLGPDRTLSSYWEAEDGSLRIGGGGPNEIWLAALESDGTTMVPCITTTAHSPTVSDVAVTTSPATLTTEGSASTSARAVAPELVVPVVERHGCAGAAATEAITGLKLVRLGVDAELVWDVDPAAVEYNVWTVTDRILIDDARRVGSPPAVGVVGCSEPAAAAMAACTDVDAIPRGDLTYYQVRGVDGAGLEGP